MSTTSDVSEACAPDQLGLIGDDELARLALAADPQADVPDDAVSLWDLDTDGSAASSLLPEWYMPTTSVGRRRLRGWRRGVVLTLVVTFLSVDCVGLCTTYGPVILGH
jgi:hypothetical protein